MERVHALHGVRHEPHREEDVLGRVGLAQPPGDHHVGEGFDRGVAAAVALGERQLVPAAAVLLAPRGERCSQCRDGGAVGAPVAGELRAHLDGGHVDPHVSHVDPAAEGAYVPAHLVAGGRELSFAVDAGVEPLVRRRPAAGFEVQVGADVSGVGLREGGDQVRRHAGEVVLARDLPLPVPGGVPLVVRRGDAVVRGHGRGVCGEPVEDAHQPAAAGDLQRLRPRVDPLGEVGALLRGVALERAAGTLDAGVAEGAGGHADLRGCEVVMRHPDGVDDAGDVGLERDRAEAEHRQVDHRVAGGAARGDVGVRGGDDHVALVVGAAEIRRQASEDLLVDGLEDQADLGGDVEEPGRRRRVGEHEGAGPLPQVQPDGELLGVRVPVHARAQWLSGHVPDAAADVQGRGLR